MPSENSVLPNTPSSEEVNRGSPFPRDAIQAFVYGVLTEIGNFELAQLTESASLDEELALESVALVELQVAIEDHFDLRLDPVRIIELNSLGRIIDYVLAQATEPRLLGKNTRRTNTERGHP